MKIPEYFYTTRDPELDALLQDIRTVLNTGRYAPQVTSTSPVGVEGEEGQELLYKNGSLVQRWHYVNGVWRVINIERETGWGFIEITGSSAAMTKAVSFAKTFSTIPLVICSYIGVKTTAGDPTKPADFDNANTLRVAAGFAPSTTGFTAAVYTGNGSAMTNTEKEGFAYEAIAVTTT